jgi:hypothetical protein
MAMQYLGQSFTVVVLFLSIFGVLDTLRNSVAEVNGASEWFDGCV